MKTYIFANKLFLFTQNSTIDMNSNTNFEKNPTSDQASLLSSSGKFGLKGITTFSIMILIYGFINTVFLITSIIRFDEFIGSQFYSRTIAVVVIGIVFTAIAMYITYKYLIIEGVKVIYKHSSPFFQKLSCKIIEKGEYIAINKAQIKGEHIDKTFDIASIFTETYDRRVPQSMQKAINFLLKRIPFSEILIEIKDIIKDRDSETASNLLYNKVDEYIRTSILGDNSIKTAYLLSLANIVVQIIFIFYLLK